MIEQKLKEIFDPYFNAPIEAWKYFASLGEIVDYKKNEVIKGCNCIERYGYFLIEGSCGLFVWKENHFVCLDLFLENSFFAPVFRTFLQHPPICLNISFRFVNLGVAKFWYVC